MVTNNKFQRIASFSLVDGKMTNLKNPGEIPNGGIKSEVELAQYLHMPYQQFNGTECKESRIEEAKSALEIILDKAKTEQLNTPIRKVLFDYWGTVEAYNCHMQSNQIRELCKTYLEAIKQLGLYETMEVPVRELSPSFYTNKIKSNPSFF